MALGFGKSDSESSGTGRTQTKTLFPTEFLSGIHKTIGGPLTTKDLFTLSPRGHSLFGYGPTQAEQPGGGFSLGFGPPQEPRQTVGTTPTAPAAPLAPPVVGGVVGQVERRRNRRPDTPEELAADAAARAGGLGFNPPLQTPGTPATPTPRIYKLADLEAQYVEDPDKVMDLPRLLEQADLNPTGFTYSELASAIANAKKYGFSGRSRGNFARILGGLQRDDELANTLGGTRGTGIF